MVVREGTFYSPTPRFGKNLSQQWGEFRSNAAEAKAISRNSWQELEDDADEINAARALRGLAFGDLVFRNKFRFFYDDDTEELLCQKNDGTVDDPVWTDAFQIRFHDGQFQVVSEGGIQSNAGFYPAPDSIGEIGESGSDADLTFRHPTRLFFNTDDGLGLQRISSGANAGQPEVRVTSPFGKAEAFSKSGRVWQVDHNYGVTPVLVQIMDNDDRVVIPDRADLSDPNTAWFYFNSVFSGTAFIATGGVGAASLVPRDPFYVVVRTDNMDSAGALFKPNLDLIFNQEHFYVRPDLDTDAGGAHKKAVVSLNLRFPTIRGGLDVENAVTAEAFYTRSSGEVSPITVEEEDGSPSVSNVKKIVVGGNGVLSDDGDGQVTIAVDGVAVDHGTLAGLGDVADHPSYALTDGTRNFTGPVFCENQITAEAFYVWPGGTHIDQRGITIPDGQFVNFDTTLPGITRLAFDDNNEIYNLWVNGVVVVSFSSAYEYMHLPVLLSDGTAAAPAQAFKNDLYTGIFRPHYKSWGVSVFGDEKFRVGTQSSEFTVPVQAEAFYVAGKGGVPVSYVESFSSAVEWEVNHNLDMPHFIAQAYNDNGELVIPDTINTNDRDVAYFYFGTAQTGKAVVLGIG